MLPARAHRLLYRKREPLFGQAPFDKPRLKVAEIGFQKFLIAVDVAFEGMQTSISFTHDATPTRCHHAGKFAKKYAAGLEISCPVGACLLSPSILSAVTFSKFYTEQM